MPTLPSTRAVRSALSAFALVGVATVATATATVPAPPEPATMQTLAVTRKGATLTFGYCATGSVETPHPGVTDVVVIVHGDGRTPCGYANVMREAAAKAGRAARTLVLAPHFAAQEDDGAQKPGRLYWDSLGWKAGEESRRTPHARPWSVSSYAALDLLVDRATRPHLVPDLRTISVVGHSGGGQFLNRYLATTVKATASTTTLARRWLIASPSSYLYLDSRRPKDSGRLGELSAAERRACPRYDSFKFGLKDRFGYAARPTDADIRSRMAATPVTYLVGGADDDPNDPSMDRSCEARWQGGQRVARARNYQTHLDDVLGRAASARHPLVVVAGAGHSAKAVLTSPQALSALFPAEPVSGVGQPTR